MSTSAKLREAMRLAHQGDPGAALSLLERALSDARQGMPGGGAEIVLLARTAATISVGSGDVRGAVAFYGEAAVLDPADAYTQCALGEAYLTLGDKELSARHFSLFEDIAGKSDDPDLQDFYKAYVSRRGSRGS